MNHRHETSSRKVAQPFYQLSEHSLDPPLASYTASHNLQTHNHGLHLLSMPHTHTVLGSHMFVVLVFAILFQIVTILLKLFLNYVRILKHTASAKLAPS